MTLRWTLASSCALLGATGLAAATVSPPAPLPPKPVSDTYFGTTVTDPYRFMEDEKDQTVIDWMKAEGRYTRAVLDSIPGHAALLKKLSAFTGSFDFVQGIQIYGGRTFYQERTPGSDNFDLLVRDADGATRKLVDIAAIRAAHGGTPYAINYFQASDDGAKVAVGISQGGSEDASLFVYDAKTGARLAGPLPRAAYGAPTWTDDGGLLFFNQLQALKPGQSSIDKFKNNRIMAWDLKGAPKAVLGNGVSPAIAFKPDESPYLFLAPGTPVAIALNINGVQNEIAAWTAPVAAAADPNTAWQPLVTRDDGITNASAAGDRLYLLSHKDAPTFKVLLLKAGQPLASAKTIVAAQPGRLIEAISAASDGLYVRARRGVYSELFKVPLDGGPEQQIALPVKGSIGELFADPRLPGATIVTESWTVPPTVLSYDPASGRTSDRHLGTTPPDFDGTKFRTTDLTASAKDGTAIPLSLITPGGGESGPKPLLLWAYGSYGISQFAAFSPRVNVALSEGISYAVCHVRGGGELGEAWRLGGKDASKPNTWRDLIACGRALVAKGYTTPKLLFIGGGSAGGITMGRAMEEAPELFAGVLDLVPSANAARQEFSPNGPGNTPEFGTVANEQGFRNLLAMDSYLNVKDGTQYPAIMITTGLNDPRVASWEPAKLAARLRTTGTQAPVFLRVEEQAGHGIGSTKTQGDELYADVMSFILWRSGRAGWQPAALPAK